MSDTQLTALSTFASLVGTVALFILLAHWSGGGTWGITSAVIRGMTSWAGRAAGGGVRSPSGGELRPMEAPRLDRLWGSSQQRASDEAMTAAPSTADPASIVELEELPSKRF